MRRAARTDANQREIVQALRNAGCLVHDTSSVGGGFPDLVVKTPARGGFSHRPSRVLLVEIKDGRKSPSARQLTEEQKRFATDWGTHWCCVTSVDEAIKVVTT